MLSRYKAQFITLPLFIYCFNQGLELDFRHPYFKLPIIFIFMKWLCIRALVGTLYLSVIGPSTQCAYYFCSNMVAKHILVTSGLKVEDAFYSFEGVQMKIKEIEDRTTMQLYK